MKAIWNFIKLHKKLSITILSVVLVVSAGLIAFFTIIGNIAKPPELQSAPETFDYATVGSLKEEFAVSEQEQARSIDDYSSDEGFLVYKKAFLNFLNTKEYNVTSTGYSNVMNILVNVLNEKKFDGTNFYMHIRSTAATEGMFASISNNDAKHYLYITDSNSKNLATVKLFDVKDDKKELSKTIFTEKDYVFNYGGIPYICCDYIIRENTVLSSTLSFDSELSLFKVEMNLDPVPATAGLIKKMYAISGTNASYENHMVKYTAYIDSGFILRRTTIEETYQVNTIVTAEAKAGLTENYIYPEDEGYEPLTPKEKYDVNDIPVTESAEAVAETKAISTQAIAALKEKGVNADFTLKSGDIDLSGRLQICFGDVVRLKLNTEIKGAPLSVYLALDSEKSGTVIASYNGLKFGINFTRLGDVIGKILPKLGIDLGGIDVASIVDGIDVNGLIDCFGGVKGTLG